MSGYETEFAYFLIGMVGIILILTFLKNKLTIEE